MRLAYYAGVSTALAAGCLLTAVHNRPNFYSAAVYLSQSNACLLILTNLCLVTACSFIYGLQRLLYGPLRPIEIEQLSEKAWYAVLDTLLAMPSFREDVGGWLLAMFTLLLAGKVWGWIGEGRVDILEQQPPANPRLFHTRLATSLVVSVAFDLWMLNYCIETVLADPRPGMMVIFTFEFAVLTVFSSFTLARYILSICQIRIEGKQMRKAIEERKEEIRAQRAAERQNETESGRPAPASPPSDEPIEVDENEVDVPGWEEKRRYLFALEVFTDFVKLMIYIVFFTVSITFNGLPMHIMRDVYMTFASFSKRVADFIAYRKATSDMNTRYPDATTEEIRGDACIVCRENMEAWDQSDAQAQAERPNDEPAPAPVPTRRSDPGLRAKKLPCGHILHLRCLKAWLERQQVCPTCRRPVVAAVDPAVPGQPGAGGGAPGQPNQQPARRQGRARFLNFGPLRIGFWNGPGDQLNNIVRQIQNPRAAGQVAAQDPVQQGPNHLGLQAPYLPQDQQGMAAMTNLNTRAALPPRIQLLQLEQRLLQDAYSLGIEQQQLVTLRMLEAELVRLRALHQVVQQPVGIGAASHEQLNTLLTPTNVPIQQQAAMATPDVLHGAAAPQYGNGHEHLPQGMTLPEDWTVIPLQRTPNTSVTVDASVLPAGTHMTAANAADSDVAPPRSSGAPASSTDTADQRSTVTPSINGASGPTDDRGSPLFVPSMPVTAVEETIPQLPSGSTEQNVANERTDEQSQPIGTTPWNSEGGWSFVESGANGQATDGDRTGHAPSSSSNGAAAPLGSASQSNGEKGKGKAVEVEDAPDPGV